MPKEVWTRMSLNLGDTFAIWGAVEGSFTRGCNPKVGNPNTPSRWRWRWATTSCGRRCRRTRLTR